MGKIEEECLNFATLSDAKETQIFNALQMGNESKGLDWKGAVGRKQGCFSRLQFQLQNEQLNGQVLADKKLKSARSQLKHFDSKMSFAVIESNRYQMKRSFDSEDMILKAYQIHHTKMSKLAHAVCQSESKRMATALTRQGKLVDQGKLQESEVEEAIVKQAEKVCRTFVTERTR